jgi:hypothetical protein
MILGRSVIQTSIEASLVGGIFQRLMSDRRL